MREKTRRVNPHQTSTPKTKPRFPTQHDKFDLSDVDYVPSKAKFSRFGAMLFVYEDNEAVIK